MKRENLLALFLYFAVALFFFSPLFRGQIPFPGDLLIGEYAPYNSYEFNGYNPGSYPNKGQNFDVIRLIYPAKFFSIEQLKSGNIPLWNANIFAGNPHLASLQSGTFYPLNLVFFVFPFWLAWTLYIIIQPILAGFFTYLFLKGLKLSKLASFLGGIVFSYSSFFVVWMEYGNLNHSFLWLPLLLLLLIRIVQKKSLLLYVLLALVLSLTILAGYIQFAIYVYAFSYVFFLFYLYFYGKKGRGKTLLVTSVFYGVSLLLAAIQLIPMAELFMQSTRSAFTNEAFMKLLIPTSHFVTYIIPDFFGNPATRNYFIEGTYIERVTYVGLMPSIFVMYAVLFARSKMVWFFLISAWLIFLLTFDTFITKFLYSLYLPPVISTGVPSRIMFLFAFPLSVLAAIGFNSLQEKISIKRIFIIIGIYIGIFGFIWASVYAFPQLLFPQIQDSIAITKRNLIIPSGLLALSFVLLLAVFFIKKFRTLILIGMIILVILDLFYFFKKITPFAPIDSLYPKTAVMKQLNQIQGINRMWAYGDGILATNLQTIEGVYGNEGYDALHIKRPAEFLSLSRNGKIEKELARSESELVSGFGNSELISNVNRKRVLDILGTKYILHKNSNNPSVPNELTFPTSDFTLVWNDNAWQIYENKKSLPRVYLAGTIITESNPQTIGSILLNSKTDLSSVVVLEKDINKNVPLDASASAVVKEYSPNKVVISTNAKTNSVLVLTDNYYDGWEAFVDGVRTPIYRANYTFRGVYVPSGQHTVEFIYNPKSFQYGLWISSMSLLALIGVGVVFYKKKHAKV